MSLREAAETLQWTRANPLLSCLRWLHLTMLLLLLLQSCKLGDTGMRQTRFAGFVCG